MFTMLKRHEIQVLLQAGHAQCEVAELAGVSERSVRRVSLEAAVSHVDDSVARVERSIGRPSIVEGFRKFITELLANEPHLKSVETLRRVRNQGYTGGKTTLYELIASLRPKDVKLEMRFEGLPGEFTQHDFGEVDVVFDDGHTSRIHFFASRLKYSRWVQISVVPDETTESLVRAMVDHFTAMGGIPLVAVFDRPKTVALKWSKDGTVTEWNPTFAYVTLELGLGVEVCWPYSPRQKGSVENLVGWVKGSFFKQRRFHDDEDLSVQLAEWHRESNMDRPCRATGVTPAIRMTEERVRLRPVRVSPEDLALRVPVSVGPTAMVLHDTHLYSMPPEAAGFPATLYLYRDRVRIVAGRFDVTHPRLFQRHARSTLPEHRSARLAEVSGKRGKQYLKRQDLLETGPAALEFLTEITHRRPAAWKQEVDLLHDLLQLYGPTFLDRAFKRALDQEIYGAEYVSHFIEEMSLSILPGREVPLQ